MNILKYFKRCALLALALVLAFSTLTFAESIPAAQARSQLVRVWLKRLGVTDRMDVTLSTGYTLTTANGESLYFHSGSELGFLLRENGIYLYYQSMAQKLGDSVTLYRAPSADTEKCGFYLTNYPALYMGDLTLDIADGNLRPVLSIHVEDYLLGVVPYEMSDSFPLEALKAQAVAARTYALKAQGANADYDVVDTTNDQVFKGYLPDYQRAERAVAETRGVCGFYKGELAQCYYSASNGGQTERVQSVWPSRTDGPYAFGEDPYDVENPLSVVRSFEIQKAYDDEAPYALRKLLAEQLADALENRGFDTAPESVRVDSVEQVVTDTPAESESKLNTLLHLSVRISGRTRTNVTVRLTDEDQEEVNLFAETAPSVLPTHDPLATFAPVVTLAPTETPAPLYGTFTQIDQTFTIDLPIFPDAEDAFGMDISSNFENEIWSVRETEDAFVLEARRYGHGVGMSQRGAEWMAGYYQMSYQDILGFYYPGMELRAFPETEPPFHQPDEALTATAGPAPSPTPRPTPSLLTLTLNEGEWYATVSGISSDSSLNLRSEPSLNGQILTRLYKGQELIVSFRCAEEGWVKVRMDGFEGYVMESYLTSGK